MAEEKESSNDNTDGKVGLKRTVGLASGVSIIVGAMIGSGIFVSPKAVLIATNSIGLCLVIWVVCGVVSMLGALCYAELGALVPASGGEFSYILSGYSTVNFHLARILGFLYSWSNAVIILPTSYAAICLASATYIITPIIGECNASETLIKIGALAIMIIIGIMNAYSIKLTQTVLVSLTFAKIFALAIITCGGFLRLIKGHTINFQNSFAGSETNMLVIASGFYGGLWAFDGWNNLNYVTEEIKNPKRNLPLSIFISLPLCTLLYVFVNVSYFTVMSKTELLQSDAVAMTWGDQVLGKYFTWLLPTVVGLSTFSSALGSLFSLVRINFVAAREGFLVKLLAMVNIHRNTPEASIIFSVILSIIYLFASDLNNLIDIFSFIRWIFYGLTTMALIIMRFTMKSSHRDFKVPLVVPIIVFFVSIYLVFAPVIENPRIEYIGAIGVLLVGFIFYVPFVHFKLNLPYFSYITEFFQNLLEIALPDKQD